MFLLLPIGTITISTNCVEEQVQIVTQGTGARIPDEILTGIFDPFFAAEDVGRGDGVFYLVAALPATPLEAAA